MARADPQRGAHVSLRDLIKLRGQSRGLLMGGGRRVATALAGNYASSFRGRGMDFDEVRIYQPGDDIRSIDWRVTARTGSTHTKLFHEERERPVFFLIDQSPEMYFGTRSAFKSVIATEVAALLAWSAGDKGDRIGGMVFSGDTHVELRPTAGQRGVLRLLKTALDTDMSRTTQGNARALTQTLARLRHVARPGSLVVMLSDFRHLDEEGERHVSYLAKHNDLLAIYIYDVMEQELPQPGRYNISHGQSVFSIDTHSKRQRQKYQQQFKARHQAVADLFRKYGVTLFDIATHDHVPEALRMMLGVTHR